MIVDFIDTIVQCGLAGVVGAMQQAGSIRIRLGVRTGMNDALMFEALARCGCGANRRAENPLTYSFQREALSLPLRIADHSNLGEAGDAGDVERVQNKGFKMVDLLDGAKIRRDHFPHHCDVGGSDGRLRMNNGSFGACPSVVLAEQRKVQDLWLEDPDDFWLNRLAPGLERAVERLRKVVGAGVGDTVALVDNLTVASATVARWAAREAWRSGASDSGVEVAVVLVSSFTYSSVRGAMDAISLLLPAGSAKVEILTVELPFPVAGDEELVEAYKVRLGLVWFGLGSVLY